MRNIMEKGTHNIRMRDCHFQMDQIIHRPLGDTTWRAGIVSGQGSTGIDKEIDLLGDPANQ